MSLTGKPQIPQAEPVVNDGFWPNLQVGDLITKFRVPSEYDQAVVKTGLVMAMLQVNRRLKSIQLQLLGAGYATFAAYNADNSHPVAGREELAIHYENAVYSTAKAYLLKQFNSLNRRAVAENAAKEAPEMEDGWLDQAEIALASIISAVNPDSLPVSDHGVYVELL